MDSNLQGALTKQYKMLIVLLHRFVVDLKKALNICTSQ